MIGDDGGHLWYTTDGGTTWYEMVFDLTGQGAIYGIDFAHHPDSPVGYMVASQTFVPAMSEPLGFIFRTIDGGASWYQLPDVDAPTPFNRGLFSVSAGAGMNFVVAGGRKYWEAEEPATGNDGIIIIGA
jgi:photosystem II stability/assembly factor-like uncharacterized protein